jgi:hypothetical protein
LVDNRIENAPATTMSWMLAPSNGQLAGIVTTLQSGKVYVKYPVHLQDLQQGLEPRLCRKSASQGYISVILDVDH